MSEILIKIKMSKLNSVNKIDWVLNSRIKSKLDKEKIRIIRKTLLSITKMEIKTSKSYNITVIEKDNNQNKILVPVNIPQKNYYEDLEQIKQNDLNIVNEIDFDPSEQANSSDFENSDGGF